MNPAPPVTSARVTGCCGSAARTRPGSKPSSSARSNSAIPSGTVLVTSYPSVAWTFSKATL